MRLAYLGTPEISVPPLRALVEAGHDVVVVVTNPDRRRGRGGRTAPSPVKAAADELGLSVIHDPALLADATHEIELGVVVAYGRLIKQPVLDAFPLVNLHFSLLPRWRGAAPVERALLAGDDETGVCLMRLEAGLDTGGVYACAQVPIGATTTAADLRATLVAEGVELLVRQLDRPLSGWIDDAAPQRGVTTYADKIDPAELEIDWARTPEEIDRLIRIGGAWTTFRDARLKVHAAELVDGVVRPVTVQPAGKSPMAFDAWRNGAQPRPDELFG
ncbi:MAG: methionyl-tRNA formyltransferase [Ilumatobacteraceae bacterium]|nr:methionyl-tRNA formyltransferase [Ilumatobacteraceae bacterium]